MGRDHVACSRYCSKTLLSLVVMFLGLCPANLVMGQEDKFHLFETASGKYSIRAKLVGFLVKGKLTPTAKIWRKDLKVVLVKEDGSKTKPISVNSLSENSQKLLKSLNKLRTTEEVQAKTLARQAEKLAHPDYTFAVEDGKAFPVCWEFVCDRYSESAENVLKWKNLNELHSADKIQAEKQEIVADHVKEIIQISSDIGYTVSNFNGREIVGKLYGVVPPLAEEHAATVFFRVGTDIESVPWTELTYDTREFLNGNLAYYDFIACAVYANYLQQELRDFNKSHQELFSSNGYLGLYTQILGWRITIPRSSLKLTPAIDFDEYNSTAAYVPANFVLGLSFLYSALREGVDNGMDKYKIKEHLAAKYKALYPTSGLDPESGTVRPEPLIGRHSFATLRVIWNKDLYQRSGFNAK